MRVYVAGQYSRNKLGQPGAILEILQNIQKGMKMSAMVMKQGYDVFCPWLDHQYIWYEPDIPKERFYQQSLAFLEVCDVILVISGEGMCGGVDREITFAKEKGIPIVRTLQELETLRIKPSLTPEILTTDGRPEQVA